MAKPGLRGVQILNEHDHRAIPSARRLGDGLSNRYPLLPNGHGSSLEGPQLREMEARRGDVPWSAWEDAMFKSDLLAGKRQWDEASFCTSPEAWHDLHEAATAEREHLGGVQ
ncbi:MAG: hypothetical protein M3Q03_18310 [Chloroflexota bacterium]|nr:hypothetical protein [Chloroflexota bacterium]